MGGNRGVADKDPRLEAIGKRIADFRKRKGLTQDELARLIDVKPHTVSRWERGAHFPEDDGPVRLAEALNVSVDDILRGPLLGAAHTKVTPRDLPIIREMLAMCAPHEVPDDATLEWVVTDPKFHQLDARGLYLTLMTRRAGMTREQSAAAREETEKHRDPGAPRRPGRNPNKDPEKDR